MMAALCACSGTPLSGAQSDRAFPRPPVELMQPPRQPEPIANNATVDDALAATIRNAGRARENADELGGLQDFITKAEAVK